jgi:hypothetical protein
MSERKIEFKMEKPVVIKLGKNYDVILEDASCDTQYPIARGCVVAEGHYGFIIITNKDGKQEKKEYPTLTSIYGVQLDIDTNLLVVYEDGQYVPWKFKRDGELVQRSQFMATLHSDREKALNQFGITPESNPELFAGIVQKEEKKSGRR